MFSANFAGGYTLGNPQQPLFRGLLRKTQVDCLLSTTLRAPAAILFISRDACCNSIAKLFGASFMGYRWDPAHPLQESPNDSPGAFRGFRNSLKSETDFYTPPVLRGAALFDNSAPAVYKYPVP